ncbi:MAG: outer membrane beta-barrel protein [Bacteroidetes bacterium]|nr:outer membrane beta-barrel protein [Bacteroidota bacterium]
MRIFFFVSFVLFSSILQGQSVAVFRGKLSDSANGTNLKQALVMLIRDSDSVLAGYVRCRDAGHFEINNLKPDTYRLWLTYPGYADYTDKLYLPAGVTEMPPVNMIRLDQVMQTALVRARKGAMLLNGDTLIYVADSFRTREGANIEDLLKKLPGVQVNRKGEIVAQGKKVERVLIDGEEFFGDDPTIATRNLDAKTVDKVQVYDSKTEEARKTGVDDGAVVKTMDIKLKEEAKKGYFGKLNAAHDVKNLYEGRAMLNAFKSKRKFSLYGIGANTSSVNMNWEERQQYGTGNNSSYEDGMWYSSYTNDETNWDYRGLPTSRNGGMTYNNTWGKHKLYVTAGYQHLEVENRTQMNTSSVLNDSVLRQTSDTRNNRLADAGKYTLKYTWALDSLTTIEFGSNGNLTKGNTVESGDAGTRYFSGENLNKQIKTTETDTRNTTLGQTLNINRKMKKAGRLLNLSGSYTYTENKNYSALDIVNTFRTQQPVPDTMLTNQEKDGASHSYAGQWALNYTEPLSKKWNWTSRAQQDINRYKSNLYSYNRPGGQRSYPFIDSLSNQLENSQNTIQWKNSISRRHKKLFFSAGLTARRILMEQTEFIRNRSINRTWNNLLPEAAISWGFAKTGNLRLNYNWVARAPSAQQLQPLVNNSNPLYLVVGNDRLVQSRSHTMNVSANYNQIIKQRYVFANLYSSYSERDFVNSSYTDSVGRTVSTTVMAGGNYSLGGYISLSQYIPKTPVGLDLTYQPNLNRMISYVNGRQNISFSQRHSLQLGASLDLDELLSFEVSFEHQRNISTSSVNRSFNNNNWTQTLTAGFDLSIPGIVELGSELEYNMRQKTAVYNQNSNNAIWNASITRRFRKDKSFIVSLTAHDLLNQNFGYNRYVTNNQLTEQQYVTFRRYILLQLTWKFKNKGVKGGGDESD